MGNNRFGKLFRQKRVKYLGAFTEALFTALPALSVINFASIAVVLYANVRPYLLQYVPWMTLPVFMLLFAAVAIFTLIVVNVFVVPSLWDYRRRQMMHETSEIMVELENIKKQLKNLNNQPNGNGVADRIKRMEEKLGITIQGGAAGARKRGQDKPASD